MKFIIFIQLLLLVGSGMAQNKSKFMCLVGDCEEEIDTSTIENIHRYKGSLDYLTIGNIGLSGYNLLYNMENYSSFSWSKLIENKTYLLKEYDVKRPYTQLSYMLGSKEEQVLSLLHTQNITQQANFSFGFDKVKSKGLYLNQASNNNHLYTNTWFKTKNGGYKISLNFDHERIFNEHNGGVTYDSLFEQDLLLNRNRELMEVNLPFASSTIKRTKLTLNQKFNFIQSIDSLNNGSTHSFVLNVSGSQNQRVFKDSSLNMDYYSYVFIDSTITYDEVSYEELEGVFGYRYTNRVDSGKTTLFPFLKWSAVDYNQGIIDSVYSSLSVGVNFSIENKKLNINVKGNYYLQGYRASDINVKGEFNYKVLDNWYAGVLASYSKRSPSLDLLSYSGNNIYWESPFITTEYVNVSGFLTSEKHNANLTVSYNDVFNPIYFNFIGEPQQIDGVSQVIQVSAQKEFRLSKWSIKPKMVYQYSGGYNIYRLPEYYADVTFGFNTKMYKNNLHLFIGADIVYYAPTDLMSYSPMTNQYYLDDTKETGNYPFIDVFLNARIKTVRFFVKATHANAGLFGFSYYGANNYPLKDRTIQFGLNWTFIN